MIKQPSLFILVMILWSHSAFARNTAQMDKIELVRIGKQLNVLLIFDQPPKYEILENLAQKALTIKFKNVSLPAPNQQKDRIYNDLFLEGIRFHQIGNELWAQFKTRTGELGYTVTQNQNPSILELAFREIQILEPIPIATPQSTIQISNIRFGQHSNHTRMTVEISEKNRIFVEQNPEQTFTKVRFSDSHPIENFEIPTYSDTRIEFLSMEKEGSQTFLSLQTTTGEVKTTFVDNPPRWAIDFFGEPTLTPTKLEQTEPTPEEIEISQKEAETKKEKERQLRRRKAVIRNLYTQAESLLLRGNYENAISQFQKTYRQSLAFHNEHQDPVDSLALQSLFRVGDAIYTMLEKGDGINFHSAIEAYETAVRVANQNEFSTDFIPRAYFQIGRAYQKMKFQNEAFLNYEILQNQFPATIEALEANFWRGNSQLGRRNWSAAITNFREYLRSSPNPKYLAATHYKIGEAYYHMKDYLKAREAFERAREIDSTYPNQDPSLLFHMGETYYETADFATAKELFKILLNQYPDADFSKWVALRLGDFLRDEGKKEEAIEIYQNAISSFSRDIALLGKLRIANIYAQMPYNEKYKESLNTYDELITFYQEANLVEEAMLRKGLTLTLFGHHQEAIEALETLTETFPENVYVTKGIVQDTIDENLKGFINYFFEKEDYLRVVAVYQDFKEKYLSDFRFDTTLFQVAYSYQKLGLLNNALDMHQFNSSHAKGSIQELTRFEEGRVLFRLQKYDQAKEHLIRFIRDYPESVYDADARKLLAEMYQETRDFSEAIRILNDTLERYDQDVDPIEAEIVPQLYNQLANLYQDMGLYAESADAYDKTILRYYHSVIAEDVPMYMMMAHFSKADMLFKVKRFPASLEAYQTAISLYRERQEKEIVDQILRAKYQIGLIYQQTGRKDEALTMFQELMNDPKAEGEVWYQLATESHTLLTRELAYENYLNQ